MAVIGIMACGLAVPWHAILCGKHIVERNPRGGEEHTNHGGWGWRTGLASRVPAAAKCEIIGEAALQGPIIVAGYGSVTMYATEYTTPCTPLPPPLPPFSSPSLSLFLALSPFRCSRSLTLTSPLPPLRLVPFCMWCSQCFAAPCPFSHVEFWHCRVGRVWPDWHAGTVEPKVAKAISKGNAWEP